MSMEIGDPIFTDKRPIVPKRIRKPLFIGGGAVAILLVGLIIGGVIASNLGSVKVPEGIAHQAKSPVYLPNSLPGSYRVSEKSFTYDEEAIVFSADDGKGNKLVFTEQPIPEGFDFDRFYEGQMQNAKKLEGLKYESAWGKAINNKQVLSISTGDTWILMTASVDLTEAELKQIVQGINR